MSQVLVKVARDLNVGTAAIVEHLNNKGFDIENKPNAKITDNMYDELARSFRIKNKESKEPLDNIFRLWNFIEFTPAWGDADTSTIDDLAPSWFARREILQANSQEYEDFLNQLKREHAIETGVVERLYDLKKTRLVTDC